MRPYKSLGPLYNDYIRLIYGNGIKGPYEGSLLKSLEASSLEQAAATNYWVAVKELKLSYRNGYIW